MPIKSSSKLQNLLQSWPAGAIYPVSTLTARGYSHVLLGQYRKSGWLVAVGRGAVARRGEQADWRGGLFALNEQKLIVHLGGKSALNFHGAVHYINWGKERLDFFAAEKSRLPKWFKEQVKEYRGDIITTNLFPDDVAVLDESVGAFSIRVSSRERAMFEHLFGVPHNESLDGAPHLMAGLTSLRPAVVQTLLETCTSIKTKRLFMILAEELKLPWVRHLDLTKVDFGTGARTLVKGGKTHPKYLLTLPEELFGRSAS